MVETWLLCWFIEVVRTRWFSEKIKVIVGNSCLQTSVFYQFFHFTRLCISEIRTVHLWIYQSVYSFSVKRDYFFHTSYDDCCWLLFRLIIIPLATALIFWRLFRLISISLYLLFLFLFWSFILGSNSWEKTDSTDYSKIVLYRIWIDVIILQHCWDHGNFGTR